MHVHGRKGTCPTVLDPIGIYDADEEMHVDLEGVCLTLGFPASAENQKRVAAWVVGQVHAHHPDIPLAEANHHYPGPPVVRPIQVVAAPTAPADLN
jgi:hypothetical protein